VKRTELENILSLTADIVRANPTIQAHRIAVGIMKLRRLQKSLQMRWNAMENYSWALTPDYCARTQDLEDKAVEIGKEINSPVSIYDKGLMLRVNFKEWRL